MSFGITASSYITGGGGNPTGDSPYANAVLSDGPLVYLPLNETSGSLAEDISGNGRDGNYANVIFEQYGLISNSGGSSVRVDNSDASVTVPYGGWMNTGELTVLISCMVPAGGIRMMAARYATDGSPNDNSWFVAVGNTGHFTLYYRTSSGTDVAVNSGVTPVDGKRVYIAAYVNATESGIRIYEEGGALMGSNTGAGGVVNGSGANLTLLCSQQPGYEMVGYMDDFALFGTSLTTSRIDQLAAAAYVPYQPWTARSEGTGPRNGTNSHTISFTPAAAGSLLIAVVGGAVTHTMVTSGWTKRLSPVDSTELAVFTKTAGSGESSFQLTHNGSNYPIEYVVYEFPAGSAYHSGIGQASSGAYPTLGGLPGVGTTVFAGFSLSLTPGDNVPRTAIWNYFWQGITDRNATDNGVTNGSYLGMGYFAFNNFRDATASLDYPAEQYITLPYEQTVLFAIQRP